MASSVVPSLVDRPSTRALFQDVEFYRATFGVKEGRIAGTGGGSLVVSLPSCPHTSSSSVRLVLIVQMNHTPTLVRTPTLPSPIAPAFQLAEPHPGSKFTTGLKHNYSCSHVPSPTPSNLPRTSHRSVISMSLLIIALWGRKIVSICPTNS